MSMTFKDVADFYKRAPTPKGNSVKSANTCRIVDQLCKEFGDYPIQRFEKKDLVLTYLGKMRERKHRHTGEPISNGHINSYVTVLRAIIRFARDELEVIDRVPKIQQLPEGKREFYFTPVQMNELCRWLDPIRGAMVKFACNTGMRNANVRLLRWDQVSEDCKWISLSGIETKNGKPNMIPLNKNAQRVLKEMQVHRDYMEQSYPYLGELTHVFAKEHHTVTANGKPFSKTSLCNEQWRYAVERAGLPKGTCFHHCRHTFASWHVMSGTNETVLMALGGWTNERSMKRYAHLSQKAKEDATKALDGYY